MKESFARLKAVLLDAVSKMGSERGLPESDIDAIFAPLDSMKDNPSWVDLSIRNTTA